MHDLRKYKQTIREAIKQESDKDPNWNWKLLAVNKTEIRIGWGYLDWLGEKNPFRVKLDEYEWETDTFMADICLTGYYPGVEVLNPDELDDAIVVCIGDKHWHDAKTLEDGLRMVIHEIAYMAHKTY